MAIIPLRAYNREIQDLIDNGQLDEAVAHCRHILATFPKHIATYRLLGKAHLEQQRISDATDIFQRVLSAIPDDFLANVGMSIIREDENNLDASIWHMELAYEAEPSNAAIQDELRRLYGRRDSIEPPKVRLTRGALARMYAKGGLFDQAVAELRAAIGEDPNRADLQLLLAEMFFHISQHIEAVEICNNILKKLPYCLAANQILAACLPEAEQTEAGNAYRQNAITMDPYFAFASPEAITSDQVPDEAITIERLEWTSGLQVEKAPEQPNWATSLGISLEKPKEETLPEWLTESESPAPPQEPAEKTQPSVSPFIWDTQEVQNLISDTSKPEAQIPDWMREAGWQAASAESAQKPTDATPEAPPAAELPTPPLEKADIPAWLKGVAPLGAPEGPGSVPISKDDNIPWLDQHEPGPTDSIIHWLEDKKPTLPSIPGTAEAQAPETPEEEMPDWLKGLEIPYPPSMQSEKKGGETPAFTTDIPAFFDTAGAEGTKGAEDKPITPTKETQEPSKTIEPPATGEESLPARGASEQLEKAAEVPEVLPDWLKELAEETPALSTETLPSEELPVELPQELRDQPLPAEPSPFEGLSALDIGVALTGEAPEITEESPFKEGSITPTMETGPEPSEEHEPEPSMEEAFQPSEGQEEAVPALPAEEIPDWIRELAAGKPAESEVPEEVSSPEKDAALAAALEAISAQPADGLETVETEIPAEAELTLPEVEAALPLVEITPAITGVEAAQPLEEQKPEEGPAVPAEELPDWLKELAMEKPVEIEPAIPEEISSLQGEAALAEALAAIPAQPGGEMETSLEEAPAEAEQAVIEIEAGLEPLEEITPIPAEAEAVQAMEELKPEEAPALPAEELPDWLKELAAERPIQAEPALSEEIPAAGVEAPLAEAFAAFTEKTTVELPKPLEELPSEPVQAVVEQEAAVEEPASEELLEAMAPAEEPVSRAELPEAAAIEEEPIVSEGVPMEEIQAMAEEFKQFEQPAEPEGEPTAEVPVAPGEAEAFAWLEGLAAEQGAKEEELITPSEQRLETPPDWVKIEAEAQLEETLPKVEAEVRPEEALEEPLAEEIPAVPAVEIPEWIKGLGETPEVEETLPTAEAEPTPEIEITPAEELPAWLREMEQPVPAAEPQATPQESMEWKGEEIPDWLKEITEEKIPAEIVPAIEELPVQEETPAQALESAEEWTPEEAPAVEIEAGEETGLEAAQPEAPTWVPEVEELVQEVATEAEPLPVAEEVAVPEMELVPAPPIELPAMPEMEEAEKDRMVMDEAWKALEQGLPAQAAELYTSLIKQNHRLDEIITDLQDALYNFPIDVYLWVSLGDAHLRKENLQEALDAYTKAEELVR